MWWCFVMAAPQQKHLPEHLRSKVWDCLVGVALWGCYPYKILHLKCPAQLWLPQKPKQVDKHINQMQYDYGPSNTTRLTGVYNGVIDILKTDANRNWSILQVSFNTKRDKYKAHTRARLLTLTRRAAHEIHSISATETPNFTCFAILQALSDEFRISK